MDKPHSKIIQRIEAVTGIPKLASILSELPASDLQSLLLSVYQARAAEVDFQRALGNADRALLNPSKIDARLMNEFDRVAFEQATEFEAVELAPVCSLGLNHVLGGIDQNNVLTTIRNAEVLGDATMPLAVECSRRRKDSARGGDATPVRLASSHRVVRLQPFDVEGFVPHFRLFSMVSAGRDTGSQGFEIQHLGEHLRFYLRLFRALASHGFSLESPLVEISDTRVVQQMLASHSVNPEEVREAIRSHRLGGSGQFLAERGITVPSEDASLSRLDSELMTPLRAEFPEAHFRFNFSRLEGLNYYSGLCLRISPQTPQGVRYPVADGGFTDWTARLLQNRKERLLTSGIGTELVCFLYKTA